MRRTKAPAITYPATIPAKIPILRAASFMSVAERWRIRVEAKEAADAEKRAEEREAWKKVCAAREEAERPAREAYQRKRDAKAEAFFEGFKIETLALLETATERVVQVTTVYEANDLCTAWLDTLRLPFDRFPVPGISHASGHESLWRFSIVFASPAKKRRRRRR